MVYGQLPHRVISGRSNTVINQHRLVQLFSHVKLYPSHIYKRSPWTVNRQGGLWEIGLYTRCCRDRTVYVQDGLRKVGLYTTLFGQKAIRTIWWSVECWSRYNIVWTEGYTHNKMVFGRLVYIQGVVWTGRYTYRMV